MLMVVPKTSWSEVTCTYEYHGELIFPNGALKLLDPIANSATGTLRAASYN